MQLNWQHIQTQSSRSYTCGYCGNPLASEKGYFAQRSDTGHPSVWIYICHHCLKPTYFDIDGIQTPGARLGGDVTGINEQNVADLYDEARDSYSVNAFTSTVLCCRKLLMHIAVSKGAQPNLKFIEYVEYLSQNNYIPPDAKDWVDHIRSKSNEANHEIVIMKEEDAKDLISFIEMLLKIIYEFPANIKKKTAKPVLEITQ